MQGNSNDFRLIGKRIPKVNAKISVTGEAKYLDDITVPGMLYGRILRSPHPHAKIIRIDTGNAERLPGVEAVITAEDTEKVKFCHMPVTPNKMALADDKVRFIGDEVAAVAAVNIDTASEALRLIKVEYEILSAVFDPEKAMEPDAPKLYDDAENNIAGNFVRHFGDVEEGFRKADFIFEDRFSTPLIPSCTIEPHGCIASFDCEGKLTFWVTTQNPQNYQKALSQVLRIPQNRIRVIRTCVGGAFGNKSVILPQDPIAAFLAKKSRKPVKIVNTREEEFTTSRGRYSMIIYLKTGVRSDGTLVSREAKVITNNGAYNNKASGITALTCNRIGNLYRVPNTRTEGLIVYTNTQYGGALRGWGGPQAHFAVESQMDIMADSLGMDPLDFRLKNANQPGDKTPWGWEISSCGLSESLKLAAESIGWKEKRKKGNGRGVGIASVLHTGAGSAGTHGAGNFSEVFMRLNSDGTCNLTVGESDIGQGSDTVISQIVSEILGLEIDDITITSNDTDVIPPSMGTWGSKVTFITGNAARLAAEDIKRQLLAATSKYLNLSEEEVLSFDNGKISRDSQPDEHILLKEAIAYFNQLFGKTPTARAVYQPTNTSAPDPKSGYGNYCPTYSFGAQAAEVEVDRKTGKVKVLNIAAAHDLGRSINPLLVEGQIEGGVAMGIGYALFEGTKLSEGEILNKNFGVYKIVNSTEMPNVSSILIETLDPQGPFNAKGIGELSAIPTAPAIANAVYNALGIRLKDLPITPQKVLEEIDKKSD